MDKRCYYRFSVKLPVSLYYENKLLIKCTIDNISTDGLRVKAVPLILPRYSAFDVEFFRFLPNLTLEKYRLPATLAHNSMGNLGLHFVKSDSAVSKLAHAILGTICNNNRCTVYPGPDSEVNDRNIGKFSGRSTIP